MEPLGNVLEFYGGNDSKMRTDLDCRRIVEEDQQYDIDFHKALGDLNKHYDGNYVVVNKATISNIDDGQN